ncbi:TPA: hypothetical protein ACX6RX_003187 [Photobacterium damselae]
MIKTSYPPATLDQNLTRYVEHCLTVTYFRHPLFITAYNSVWVNEKLEINAQINCIVTSREKKLAELEAGGKYVEAIMFFEPPFRLSRAMRYIHHLSNHDYFEIVSWLWVNSPDSDKFDSHQWERLFTVLGPMPSLKTDEFTQLPEILVLYRYINGISIIWSTNLELICETYGVKNVLIGEALKSNVMHYLPGSNEVIIQPYHFKEIGLLDGNN